MELLNDLKWRYATKKYDASKKVSQEDFNKIQEAIQLAATSYGLQLFKVLNIEDRTLREKLLPASWGQPQITDASHLLVFCTPLSAGDTDIDAYLKLKSDKQGIALEDLSGYGDFMKGSINAMANDLQKIWMAKQTYIALSNGLNAAAALKIDSTPMEGFDPVQYSKILGLEEKGLQATVVLTLGYRSEEDATQHGVKVRKSIEDLFETI